MGPLSHSFSRCCGRPPAGIGACAAYVLAVSAVAWLALKFTMGIRVTKDEELEGLDHCEHGNVAYHGFQMTDR